MYGLSDEQLLEVASKYGTPIYVTDLSVVEKNYADIYRAFNEFLPTRVLYAEKANYNPAILACLGSLGAWIDASSPFEIGFAMRSGIDPSRISFTPANAGPEELRYATETGVNVIVVDSSEMLAQLSAISSYRVALRLNPGIRAGHSERVMTGERGSKFGIYPDDLRHALNLALEKTRLVGLHSHIGSGIREPEPYLKLIDYLRKVVRDESLGLEFIDIGGGFDFSDIDHFRGVARSFSEAFGDVIRELRVEPGRYLVKRSSVLLTKVNQVKQAGERRFAQVDAGMNALIRPMLYGAFHPMRKLGGSTEEMDLYDVVGPICENTDVFGRDVKLSKLREGDVIAIEEVGAYGYSMSSNYNLRPRPAELVVKGSQVLLYKPMEGLDDLFAPYALAGFKPALG
ncbi:MAG TPA: diaminopimelate decarboxylase, partial [Thermoprotei archaeon]|nr:diaminopimelate decarboxylase [Thermoprotei archaeon]